MRIFLAIRVFFVVLFQRGTAEQIKLLLQGQTLANADGKSEKAAPKPKKETPPPTRSDALTLLATLQREARFVDFIQEQLGDFSDEQIGAAARDVHRDCCEVLKRLFDIQPATNETEGSELEVPAKFDPGQYKLTGNVSGDPPFRGSIVHHGWQAAKCELPQWSGTPDAAKVIGPIEVELP